MNDASATWLIVIAVSVAVMAVVQVGVLVGMMVYGGRLVKRTESLAQQVQDQLGPLSANLTAITRDAARAASLAAAQVERADQLFADFARRVEETMTIVQGAIVRPVREGVALVAGLKAALAALRDLRETGRRRGVDDDDALFI